MSVAQFAAQRLLTASLATNMRSVTEFSKRVEQKDGDDPAVRFRKALYEVAGYGDLFRCFPRIDMPARLKDQVVLDFGCGYGGKTVEYAARCGARRVCGVEPFPDVVEKAAAFAAHCGVGHVEFKTCAHLEIPYDEATFDVVLTMDVLEHVEDPRVSLTEIHRVLKPGGAAFIVFPPYDGAMSHHLDYICLVPGVHWIFSPHTLVNAVNALVAADGAAKGVAKPQPAPKRSWDATRHVLPNLNGLTGTQFQRMAAQLFEIDSLEWAVIGRNHPAGWKHWVHRSLTPLTWFGGSLRDAVTSSITAIVRKRA